MQTIIKTYTLSACMEEMSAYAAAYEQTGGYNLIFCEDRLTLIAERALLARLGGTFSSQVTTFARFLKGDERSLSKQGAVMAVGDIMTRLQREGKLQCFTTAAGVGNYAASIYETLAQFSASQITPDTLRESLALLPEDSLKRKIADLAEIYQAYSAFLQEKGYLDESKYFSLLPEKIRRDKQIKNANVFFLGYSSFTAQAQETVRAVLECAKNVVGIFCGGEEDIYTNDAIHTFEKVCKEYGKTRIIDRGQPLLGDAETLRKGLYNPLFAGREKVKTDKIFTFEAEDKMAETEYVAVQIRRALAKNEQLYYRDIAVLVPDVGSYALALKRAFTEYKIPYFIDEKRSLDSHPLARFLLDCFRVVREKYASSAVQALAANYFFGESAEYRNYLYKFANYRGGAKREIKRNEAVTQLFDLSVLESGRQRLLRATSHIKNKAKGQTYCAAVRQILTDFDVENTLKNLQSQMDDVAQKSFLAQIYRSLEGLLNEAELLLGDREMTVTEFLSVLQDGLQATEISLIPLKADAVFVGNVTESRIEKVQLLFAMGMTEQVPGVAQDTAIVSDKEIARLQEVKAMLEPTVAEVNLRHRESVCLNLCAFLEELHLSYPLTADGNEPAVSEIFHYVDQAFVQQDGNALERRKKITDEDFSYLCGGVAPAIRQLLLARDDFVSRKTDTRQRYASVFTALDKLSVTEKDDFLREREGQVCVERGEELFFRDGKISPTALEGYFTCPFKNFIDRGLRLKDREETAVLAVDTGNFIHELLEITTKEMSHIQTEEEMRAFALKTGEELLKKPVYAVQADTASGSFFSGKLLQEGADVVLGAYRQVKHSKFVVEETEKTISAPDFHGKVDRVDGTEQYVRIIDYKTGKIDDAAASYYTGRKLQMQLYMSALKGERIPAGVFYFPASVEYKDNDEGRFRMQGFLNGENDALLAGDTTLTEGKKSEFFPATLGDNSRSKRVMDEQTFRDFLDYSIFVTRQACSEIKEGFIAPSPYKGACTYCKYGGMCGFNREQCSVRNEETIDPPTIAEIARNAREGKEE